MQARAIRNGALPGECASPLVVRRRGRRLMIRLLSADEDGHTQLWMEEQTDPQAIESRDDLRLTSREWQVLLEVEKGKHNDEIAVELGIQPRTVKKHLEHIFDKLGVDNRTAAVARLHRIRSRSP
jgi:DNA-binding NarL/FixJ family response regulator